jgi:Leucine-rich repeat (LRR) protein
MQDFTQPRTKVFISYSHQDERWLKRLCAHLKPFERAGRIDPWVDTRITTGQRWRAEIQRALEEAKVAVLLISPHFLASEFISDHELPTLLSAEQEAGLVVLPVLLSPSTFKRSHLAQFQALPRSKTLSEMRRTAEREQVWVELTDEILRHTDPGALPDEMKKALEKNVKELDLTGIRAATLPAEIAHLSQLTTLYLSRNQLSTLPAEIVQLSRLTTLYLARNMFTTLPVEITKLAKLKALYFSRNRLTTLPSEIRQLRTLRLLDLSHNALTAIPSEIGQLSELTALKLAGNQLRRIPSEIGHLAHLQHLDLSGNNLTTLPSELKQLRSLHLLDLRRNPFPIAPTILEDIHHPARIWEALERSNS